MKVLPISYFTHDDVHGIAKDLLGKVLCSNVDDILCKAKIVETEAYTTPGDRACHAYTGIPTPRTQTMFEKGGIAYVYVCYGLHHLINVVTGPKGNAQAILIRAVEPLQGLGTMSLRRKHLALKKETTNGPGKLCKALGIDKSHNGIPLYNKKGKVWIEDHDVHIQEHYAGPRVGLSSLCGSDAFLPWRYYIKNNKYVSNPKHVNYPETWKLH